MTTLKAIRTILRDKEVEYECKARRYTEHVVYTMFYDSTSQNVRVKCNIEDKLMQPTLVQFQLNTWVEKK